MAFVAAVSSALTAVLTVVLTKLLDEQGVPFEVMALSIVAGCATGAILYFAWVLRIERWHSSVKRRSDRDRVAEDRLIILEQHFYDARITLWRLMAEYRERRRIEVDEALADLRAEFRKLQIPTPDRSPYDETSEDSIYAAYWISFLTEMLPHAASGNIRAARKTWPRIIRRGRWRRRISLICTRCLDPVVSIIRKTLKLSN